MACSDFVPFADFLPLIKYSKWSCSPPEVPDQQLVSQDSWPTNIIMTFSRYGWFVLATFSVVPATINQEPLGPLKDRPNIVFIFTDDQDVELGSLDYMPLLHKHLINEGTLFSRHYCTTAICCPSRVTLWTGKNAHNTNVTDIFPPYG